MNAMGRDLTSTFQARELIAFSALELCAYRPRELGEGAPSSAPHNESSQKPISREQPDAYGWTGMSGYTPWRIRHCRKISSPTTTPQ